MVEIDFFYETKASVYLSQWGKCVYGANYEKKWDFYMNPCLSKSTDEL